MSRPHSLSMNTGYVKIYGSILDSSVWNESPATRCAWVTLLAMCDADGKVEASNTGLARRANIPLTDCLAALKTLESPDLESKSPEWGGRRIERIDGGFQILNYTKYREMRTPKQVSEAERKKRWRDGRTGNGGTPEGAPDWMTSDIANLLEALMNVDGMGNDARRAWEAEIRVASEGMHGPVMNQEQIDRACRDYVGNGHMKAPALRHFRGFLRDAARPQTPHRGNGKGKGPGKLEQGRQNLADAVERREQEKGGEGE